MLNVEKHKSIQLNLFEAEEWIECSKSVSDESVSFISSDSVSKKLLSECEEERVLTVRLMEKIVDLSNLEKACRKVKSNRGSGGVDGIVSQGVAKLAFSKLATPPAVILKRLLSTKSCEVCRNT